MQLLYTLHTLYCSYFISHLYNAHYTFISLFLLPVLQSFCYLLILPCLVCGSVCVRVCVSASDDFTR